MSYYIFIVIYAHYYKLVHILYLFSQFLVISCFCSFAYVKNVVKMLVATLLLHCTVKKEWESKRQKKWNQQTKLSKSETETRLDSFSPLTHIILLLWDIRLLRVQLSPLHTYTTIAIGSPISHPRNKKWKTGSGRKVASWIELDMSSIPPNAPLLFLFSAAVFISIPIMSLTVPIFNNKPNTGKWAYREAQRILSQNHVST